MVCNNCGKIFDDPDTVKTSYEDYYGVAGDVCGRTPLTLEVCPFCGDEDIAEEPDEDEDEE